MAALFNDLANRSMKDSTWFAIAKAAFTKVPKNKFMIMAQPCTLLILAQAPNKVHNAKESMSFNTAMSAEKVTFTTSRYFFQQYKK